MNPLFALLARTGRGTAFSLCCAAALALSACLPKTVLHQPASRSAPTAPAPVPADSSSVAAAEAAYAAGDVVRAEQIATRLSAGTGAAPAEAARVWRILALSAQANRHPNLSLTALDRWRALQKDADATDEWQRTWSAALAQLPPYEARPRIEAVANDSARPFPLRAEAGTLLASRQWSVGDSAAARATLRSLYASAADKGQKILLEHRLFEALHAAEPAALSKLASRIAPEQEKQYPDVLIRLEQARRLAQENNREAALETVAALREGNELADPGVFAAWDAATAFSPGLSAKELAVTPLPGQNLALILPLGGQFGNLAEKIALGAATACAEFAAAGRPVRLTVIDTDQPDWLERLAALPPAVTIVGGPLRIADYTAAKSRGPASGRALLSFLPQLSEQDEGVFAWRFFPSPEDQIQALFRLTRGLGVNGYAVLMPDKDAYAARMAQLFESEARRAGASVARTATYSLNEPESWNRAVAAFLGTNKQAAAPPRVPFQAVFLPGDWKDMESLLPNLFYFRETRQVLLGSSVWAQELANLKVPVDARYHGLTAFPGAWRMNPHTPAGEALDAALTQAGKGGADFWTGLGYDFARFAATLDIKPGWTADDVNAQLHGHAGMAWSMAPLRWDRNGRAGQELFLFTPRADGYAPVNVEQFRHNFERAWETK